MPRAIVEDNSRLALRVRPDDKATLMRAVALLSNVALDKRADSTLLTLIELASTSVRRPLTSALLDARSAAIATVFAWRFDVNAEFKSTSVRRPLTSDALVTVFEAVLAIAVSKLELNATTFESVLLRLATMPSIRLELDDSCVLSSVTAPAWSN